MVDLPHIQNPHLFAIRRLGKIRRIQSSLMFEVLRAVPLLHWIDKSKPRRMNKERVQILTRIRWMTRRFLIVGEFLQVMSSRIGTGIGSLVNFGSTVIRLRYLREQSNSTYGGLRPPMRWYTFNLCLGHISCISWPRNRHPRLAPLSSMVLPLYCSV